MRSFTCIFQNIDLDLRKWNFWSTSWWLTSESSQQRCSVRKGVLRNFWKENTCEFCEISKNTFFTEHLRTTASGLLSKVCNLCFYHKIILIRQGIRSSLIKCINTVLCLCFVFLLSFFYIKFFYYFYYFLI